MNLPNKLTILRIIMVPLMVIVPFLGLDNLYTNSIIPLTWIVVEAIFVIASITDKLDGYLARSRNQITNFGKFLDPIADKILVLAAMIMLVEANRLPGWIPIIVLFREFVVSGYRLIVVENNGKVIAASIWGKLKTVTQMIAIIMAFFDNYAFFTVLNNSIRLNMNIFEILLNLATSIIMSISVIATIFSGYEYLKGGKDLLKK